MIFCTTKTLPSFCSVPLYLSVSHSGIFSTRFSLNCSLTLLDIFMWSPLFFFFCWSFGVTCASTKYFYFTINHLIRWKNFHLVHSLLNWTMDTLQLNWEMVINFLALPLSFRLRLSNDWTPQSIYFTFRFFLNEVIQHNTTQLN